MIELRKRKKQRRALFGGALRCAGLAAAAMTANAMGDFIPVEPSGAASFNYTEVYAGFGEPGGGGTVVFNYSVDSFPAPSSLIGSGGSLSAYAGPSLIGAYTFVSGDPWTYGFSGVWQYFTVDSAKEVLMEWDFTTGYQINAYAAVYQIGGGFLAVESTPLSGAGSVELTLLPGFEYYFRGDVGATGGLGFARLSSIPAPGALSLLGLGLGAGRRRRRE